VWLVPRGVFAGTVALSWIIGIVLAFRHDDLVFERFEIPGRGPSLWSGAFTGFLTLVALFGTLSLPGPDRLGLTVALLVLGVGFAALGFGIGMARARQEGKTSAEKNPRAAP
jgi:protein-S-isoprenylcysteine O-methyltransferase Ste14